MVLMKIVPIRAIGQLIAIERPPRRRRPIAAQITGVHHGRASVVVVPIGIGVS